MKDIIYNENCLVGLKKLPDSSVDCCVTSPPYYGLRNYGNDEQIGLEETPELFVEKLVEVFREVKRVLKDEGTLWLNLGDSYCGSGVNNGETNPGLSNNAKRGDHTKSKRPNSKINGIKPKDLIGIPWMVAFALRADGWYLRQDIIWHKPNPMPESVTDRCTKAHEYIFLLSKSKQYYFDNEAIQEKANYDGRKDTVMKGSEKYADGSHLANGNANSLAVKGRERWKFKNLNDKGQSTHSMHEKRAKGKKDEMYAVRNKRSVWTVTTKPFSGAHFATFPEDLIVDCIKAGCPEKGLVLDPFMGAGTTAVVAKKLNRHYIGYEINSDYIKIAENRLQNEIGLFL